MITTDIGGGGFYLITDSTSVTLLGAGPNNAAQIQFLLGLLRRNIYIDNEGETVYGIRLYVNTAVGFVTGSQDVQANLAANLALGTTKQITEALWVKGDGNTIEYNAGKLRLKDGAVGNGKMNSSALEAGLTMVGTKVGVLLTGTTLEFNAGGLRVRAAGITNNELGALAVALANMAANSVDENKIISSVVNAAGAITGGSGTKFAVNVDGSTVEISGNALRVKDTSITTSKLADNNKYFTLTFDLLQAHTGAKNELFVGHNFTIVEAHYSVMLATVAAINVELFINGASQGVDTVPIAAINSTANLAFGGFPVSANGVAVYGTDQNRIGITATFTAAGSAKITLLCKHS